MKFIFDQLSFSCSRAVTKSYSTSFSLAVQMLDHSIRDDIHAIYGFVRLADEIVDTFHNYNKKSLLDRFNRDMELALEEKISLNPILNSFQETVHRHNIDYSLITAFMKSMRMDLEKKEYISEEEYKEYIYGSADVVGLMCLKIFVKGDNEKYEKLKASAMSLGSAFQKVNFLRDIKDDIENLDRSYFPNVDLKHINQDTKKQIIEDIENDFQEAYKGIVKLPCEAKFGVYTAYCYYKKLLNKLKNTPSEKIMETRVRVSNPIKLSLLAKSYMDIKFNFI